MSGKRRQRDSLAPSLFPFLAVLLCTMGALVLLLMLIVSDAQVKANEVERLVTEQKDEFEAVAQAKIRTQKKQFEDTQFELEQKRLSIQAFEEHIAELTDELERLGQSIVLAKDESSDAEQKQRNAERMSELEKQLAEAKERLAQQLEKPTGDKPVFAVIPYEGPHGTHRRPIYLECTASGVRIQPDGVLLSLEHLSPPYGPGNPLDSALRAIRSEFKPANGAITRTAYPLLLVRPSGITTYAMARAALGGWDDQFGYELIDEDLELVFPSSVPGLVEKITKAIEIAQQRQQALVQAMPRKYQRLDALGSLTSQANGEGRLGGSPNYAGTGDGRRNSDSSGSGGASADGYPRKATNSLGAANAAGGARGTGSTSSNRYGIDSPYSDLTDGLESRVAGVDSEDFLGVGGQLDSFVSETERSNAGSSFFDTGNGSRGGEGATSANSDVRASSSFAGNSSATTGGSSATAGAQATSSLQMGNSNSQSGPGGGAAAAMMGHGAQTAFNPGGQASSKSSSSNASESSQASPLGLNVDFGKTENAKPVAATRGRNWAWRDGPRTQTPVVRNLYLHCFDDRWVLLPENGDLKQATTVLFAGTPEDRAVVLAKAVMKRVDEWGLALLGGYWKPVLVVDVAPKAAWRYNQLVRLLEGSGIEIRKRTKTASNPGSASGTNGSSR
ncbi:MAG: hypothetical protein AAF483_09385 [Planctomycetota bacterium]